MLLLCVAFVVGVVRGALPPLPDCNPAQATPFSNVNPINLFGVNHEIGIKATPHRVGNLRQQGPLPTGHFATNHIKNSDIWPMIVTPYQSLLTDHGAVHDSYTLDRWSDPERSDVMDQQSPSEAGKPWNKLTDMGSNMRQMTSGPDGNPRSAFTGKSGVQVTIDGAGEPEMTSFGELYANFLYRGSNGGTMEGANPVVKPFCLSSINGNTISFDCPLEPSAGDGGGGHLEGECHGSTLTITLHNSKIIRDITKVQFQYALEPTDIWTSDNGFVPPMRTCTAATCQHVGNKVIIKTTSPAHNYKLALNVIGIRTFPYLRWLEEPYQGACDGSTITDGSGGSSSSGSGSTTNNNPATTTAATTARPTQPPPTWTRPTVATTSQPSIPAGPSNIPTVPLDTPSKKFIMELDEPGSDLLGVTRKFILYFSSPVVPRIETGSQTIRFEPPGGGKYSGLLQLGYTGSSRKGDGSQTSFLDPYVDIYSYKPRVQYCVSESANKGFLSFEWNPVDVSRSPASTGNLLMVAMPHHELLMVEKPLDTPFTFKGYVSDDWLMVLPVLHTEVDPDPLGVLDVKDNPSQLQDILAAIERDAQNANLDAVCSHTDSYNGGKAIGMVTRLASLSRAFGTDHYIKLDQSIQNCLEKWLRVQGG
ncbi:endo-1,3(4)-beta-glucanase 1 [Elysia marginata]|uniref:Endo-1,3(4)-beta-glucanase 1 n=1 Tax=Elysia marginata TaxID=1093978 RepID=A0AAV4GQF5_9GAST|nr:endo-1,3(4)-beta-glucanase 1 [Elysia marginata]